MAQLDKMSPLFQFWLDLEMAKRATGMSDRQWVDECRKAFGMDEQVCVVSSHNDKQDNNHENQD